MFRLKRQENKAPSSCRYLFDLSDVVKSHILSHILVRAPPVNLPFRADEVTQLPHQQGSEQRLLCRTLGYEFSLRI